MTIRVQLPPRISLTDIQLKQLKYLAEGLTTKEISTKRNVGISTVKRMNETLFAKFNAMNRTQLVALGFKYGFLE